MRRLTQRRVRTFYLRKRTTTKDAEGVPSDSYGVAAEVRGEVWPAKSTRQIEQYGDRVSGIQNMRIEGVYTAIVDSRSDAVELPGLDFTLTLGDGVCINAGPDDTPDYRVLAITRYKPLLLEVERARG